ncbi:trypsin domain-containing protein [Ditylenchus destructor]|nr:trypsin domain-containing protein [Ditylenchus destructor]
MREVAVEFAAYEPRVDADLENSNVTIKIRNMGHDMAIIQLKEDLVQHFGNESALDDTRVACLPQLTERVPDINHVYGWGLTEKGAGSPHLMEVELKTMNNTADPILQNTAYQQNVISQMCLSDRLYCMHPKEGNNNQDGAQGDSGSGIVGRRGPLAILFGSTIAGAPQGAGFIMNIATKTQAFEYDLCHRTGVCTEKAWVGMTEESKLTVNYHAFFDPLKPQNVEV